MTKLYKVAKITLVPRLDESETEVAERIDNLLSALYMNGQIIESILEYHGDKYVATVVTTDDDSLESKYNNAYVQENLEGLELSYEIVCDDPSATDCCHCEDHSFYILAINPSDDSSPIICGDCGKEIPLIRVPYLYLEEEHWSILNFQRTYKAVDRLWMDSLSDRFTKRQITDHKSQLNRLGEDIRAELENKTGKPVYYLLANPIGGWFEFEKNNKVLEGCPKCGNALFTTEGYFDGVLNQCHGCRLAFVTFKAIEKT